MRRAVRIELTDDERATLVKWSRGKRIQARLVVRASMILLAADDLQNREIAEELKTSQQCVGKWRKRFAEHHLSGIEKDLPPGGRKPSVRSRLEATIVRKTIEEKRENATQWSVRSMAKAVGVSKATVQRVWRDNGLKPHLIKTFKSSAVCRESH